MEGGNGVTVNGRIDAPEYNHDPLTNGHSMAVQLPTAHN